MSSVRQHVNQMQRLYAENDFPSERLIKDTSALTGFTQEFNLRTGGSFDPKTIADEIERIRKSKVQTGGLPRLGRKFGGPKFKG